MEGLATLQMLLVSKAAVKKYFFSEYCKTFRLFATITSAGNLFHIQPCWRCACRMQIESMAPGAEAVSRRVVTFKRW